MGALIHSVSTILLIFVVLGSVWVFPSARAAESWDILLPEKAPYYYSVGNVPSGFLYEHFACIMNTAKIPFTAHFQPINRILHRLKHEKKTCSLGWFQTDLRSSFAQFSGAVWEDQPMGVVVHKDSYRRLSALGSLEKLLTTAGLRAVLPENVSYGQTLDTKLQQSRNIIQTSTVNFDQTLTMVASKRADYTISTILEFNWRKKQEKSRQGRETLELIRFKDMPAGELRYLMCSKGFDPERLAAFNQALLQHKKTCSQRLVMPD